MSASRRWRLLRLAVMVGAVSAAPARGAAEGSPRWKNASASRTAAPRAPRARAVVPVSLSLDIALDLAGRRFDASVTHRLRALSRPLRRIELESSGLEIRRVADERGRPLRFTVSTGALAVFLSEELPPGAETTLRIDYSGSSRHMGLHFFRSSPDYPGRPDAVWSHGQPDLTGHWIPIAAEPGDRCPTDVSATVPEGFTAVSNGVLVSTAAGAAPGTVVFRWRQERPHPVHLIALYVGRYDVLGAEAVVREAGSEKSIPIHYWIARGQSARAKLTFAAVPRMLEFFSEATGTAYPWDKYDIAVLYQPRFGAMENTSAAGLREDFLIDPRSPVDTDGDFVLAHELLHQWYGDLLSCRSWAHVWLNESPASYLQSLWTERERGPDAFEYDLLLKARRYFAEARTYRRPIVTDGYAQASDMFDAHTYDKGAWVLHMLRRRVGDRVFWAGLREYTARHKDGSVVSGDLRAAFERAGSGELKGFFEQWLYRPGHPVLAVTMRWSEESKEAVVTVARKPEPDGGPAVPVPLSLEFGAARDGRVRVELAKPEQTYRWPLAARPSMIRLDPGFELLAEYELDIPEDMLRTQLQSDPSIAGRIRAAQALSGRDAPSVDALGRCLLHDPFWGVVVACAERLASFAAAEPPARASALAALRAATGLGDPRVRRAAAAALGSYHKEDEAYAALASLAQNDSSALVQAAAIEALGSLELPRAKSLLLSRLHLDSWNETVRRAALMALARFSDPDVWPLLETWAGAGKPPAVRAAALTAAAQAREPDVERRLDFLLKTLEADEDRAVRTAAIAALRRLGRPRAEAALLRVASADPEAEMRRLAREAADAVREKKN